MSADQPGDTWPRSWVRRAYWLAREPGFLLRHRALRQTRKFIYLQTPPPALSNIGDHAQALAIHRWFRRHFPDMPVLEVTKPQTDHFLDALAAILTPDDVIFQQSGGNLNDFAVYSESIRRKVIARFPDHRIIVLPQTIAFRDTEEGRIQQALTSAIYATHGRLTIIGRDPVSAARAKTLFPRALTFMQPDFVLSLPPAETPAAGGAGTLLCLRHDGERLLSDADTDALERSLPGPTRRVDTWVRRIPLHARTKYLRQILDLFARHDAVVTDRFHGVIFAALARVPCVAIPTSTHKVASGMAWFREVRFIRFTSDLSAVPAELEAARADRTRNVPNWESEYFDSLPDKLGLK